MMMNEWTKKIAGEARLLMFTDDKGNHYVSEGNLQRFAELIVKECADVVRTSLLPSQNKIPATVALDIGAKNIELLFGVEE